MKDPLLIHVKNFLKAHHVAEKPLLLGFSGGGDSLALLHLLLEAGAGSSLHLAHVDHGWRPESREEAESLSAMARKLDLPFHLHALTQKGKSNLEEGARIERLAFFSKVYREIDAQALLLGHHADDQAETVLKRVLEGAHLLSLGGIKEISSLEGMQVWRPLLKFHKQFIVKWLDKRGFKGIEDSTNHDPSFLRARLRTQVLPSLAESYGKEISSNLVRLGRTMEQVEAMMTGEIDKTLSSIRREATGIFLDIPESYPRVLRSAIVKRFLQGENFFLSYESLETVCSLLESKKSKRHFLSKGKKLIVNRGTLTVFVSNSFKN